MSDNTTLQELYQALILDHNKNPRNFRIIENPSLSKEGFNPVCGDHYHLYVTLNKEGDTILDIAFQGEGCAISKASASMMTAILKGKTVHEAEQLFQEFHDLLLRKLDPDKDPHHLGKLKVFSGIWKYPARVKCAGLSWHTLHAALNKAEGVTQTE